MVREQGPGGARGGGSLHGHVANGIMGEWSHGTPPCGQTDTTENLPTTLLAVKMKGNLSISFSHFVSLPKIVVVEAMLVYEASNFKSLKSLKLIRA